MSNAFRERGLAVCASTSSEPESVAVAELADTGVGVLRGSFDIGDIGAARRIVLDNVGLMRRTRRNPSCGTSPDSIGIRIWSHFIG